MENLEALNNQLFLAINGAVGSPAWLVDAAMAIGDGLIFLVPALLAVLWLAGGARRRSLALRAFAVAFAFLFGGARRLAAAALTGALAVAWARVFLGVHFPLDMVGAALVALVAWTLIAPIWRVVGAAAINVAEAAYRRVFAWPISAGWIRN